MAEPRRPALVLCAHGTRDPMGRATVRDVVDAVADRLPGVEVLEAFVDVHGPEVADVVAGLTRAPGDEVAGVVVPLLLAAGYHVHVDIARAVAERPVVLAPAGSSDERAQADSADMAERLAARWGGSVSLGYAAGPAPAVADAVTTAREASGGMPVAVASYLLAPGFFQGRVEASGADVVTGPVAPDPRVVEIVLSRYRAVLES